MPPDFPYTGEWLHENCLFLYRSQSAQTLEDTDPEMTVVVPAPNGKTFVGFNSITLAIALHMESEQVFEHNRARTLCVVDAQIAPVTRGASCTKRYVFQVDNLQAPVIAAWELSKLLRQNICEKSKTGKTD